MKIGINLLPQNKKEEIAKAEKFRSVLGWEAILLSIGVFFFAFIFGIDQLLNLNLQLSTEAKSSDLGGEKYQTIKYYENKFSEINAKLSKISSVSGSQLYWSGLFSRLDKAVPDGIEINGLSTKDFAVFLSGKAKNREDLLFFKDRLGQDECFDNINLPLSNLVSKEDIVFQLDLEIKEICIKNK